MSISHVDSFMDKDKWYEMKYVFMEINMKVAQKTFLYESRIFKIYTSYISIR